MGKNVPDGFNCITCKKRHAFGVYVAAHSTITLQHVCDACGAQHHVRNYIAKQVKKGKVNVRK